MTEELWRPIPDRPAYEVSTLGRVRRITRGRGTHVGRILAAGPDEQGYRAVRFTGSPPVRVHALVAAAFLEPVPPGGHVHHLNEDRADNRLSNLEVCPSVLAHGERHRRSDRGLRRHGEPNPTVACGCGCGVLFPKYGPRHRPRRFLHGHGARREGVV